MILRSDGTVAFQDPKGNAVAAEKYGENTMTPVNYWLSRGARFAAMTMATAVGQAGTLAVLTKVPDALVGTLGAGTLAPITAAESKAVPVGLGLLGDALGDMTFLSIPPIGTQTILFQREVSPGQYDKICVVVTPDKGLAIPENGWTPLNH